MLQLRKESLICDSSYDKRNNGLACSLFFLRLKTLCSRHFIVNSIDGNKNAFFGPVFYAADFHVYFIVMKLWSIDHMHDYPEPNPWEANPSSASQEIPQILWNPNGH
jgi:hypothetical protein